MPLINAKIVEVFDIELISYQNNLLKVKIDCGSGTYIRSIGRDIAYELNSFATMTELIRTQIDNITLENCCEIKDIDNIEDKIIPIKEILSFQTLDLDKQKTEKLLNGQKIIIELPKGVYSIEDEYDTIALVKIEENIAKMSLFLG